MLAMFIALFGATRAIQVVKRRSPGENPHNKRALYDSFEVQRGSIIAGDEVIATPVPSDDIYSWQRQYADATMPACWGYGFINPLLQSATGLERAMNRELSGTASSQFLAGIERIITGQPARGVYDLVTLDPALAEVAFDALLGDDEGAVVAMKPKTGRILAMATSPSYDPNTLAVHNAAQVNAT
ncbi:penicillin-binding transpeptidase domain-containing protein, partial [Microbacterium aurum]